MNTCMAALAFALALARASICFFLRVRVPFVYVRDIFQILRECECAFSYLRSCMIRRSD